MIKEIIRTLQIISNSAEMSQRHGNRVGKRKTEESKGLNDMLYKVTKGNRLARAYK